MPRHHVYPSEPAALNAQASVGGRQTTLSMNVPMSDMQALMEAPPHTEPAMSWPERMPRREAVMDAWDAALNDREKWILGALLYRGMSLREAGREIGVSYETVRRVRIAAIEKLRRFLIWGPDGPASPRP